MPPFVKVLPPIHYPFDSFFDVLILGEETKKGLL
jgi:hypothetical protein